MKNIISYSFIATLFSLCSSSAFAETSLWSCQIYCRLVNNNGAAYYENLTSQAGTALDAWQSVYQKCGQLKSPAPYQDYTGFVETQFTLARSCVKE